MNRLIMQVNNEEYYCLKNGVKKAKMDRVNPVVERYVDSILKNPCKTYHLQFKNIDTGEQAFFKVGDVKSLNFYNILKDRNEILKNVFCEEEVTDEIHSIWWHIIEEYPDAELNEEFILFNLAEEVIPETQGLI